MKKKKFISPESRYEGAPAVDMSMRVNLENEKSLLRTDDRDVILDLTEQFITERSNCKRYKFYGKMKMIFRNLYLGTSDYLYLRERLALESDGSDDCFAGYLPYNEFAFLRRDLHREVIVNQSLDSLTGFNGFEMTTSGSTEHRVITSDIAHIFNWNFYLTYIFDHDLAYPMKYTITGETSATFNPVLDFVSGDGIPFRVAKLGETAYILTSPVKHGINQGEYILIDDYPKPFYVYSVGNNIYRSEDYVITLLRSEVGGYEFNGLVTGKRCTDINDIENSTSQYYVHLHKTLTTPSDHIVDKVGFESPIWENEVKLLYENSAGTNDVVVERNRMEAILFDHFEPFVLSGITNNLGYTPTELYTTIIFRNGNGYFEYPPKVGWSFHFHDSWIDEHFDGDTTREYSIPNYTFSAGGTSEFLAGLHCPVGTTLNGAFVEYNPKSMKERVISEAFHKISTNPDFFNHGQSDPNVYSGASSTNMFGLYYQPHYRFKVRELSPYTETSATEQIYNLPENARFFANERVWRWRDLYEVGYVDPDGFGTDYPFMNNIHYIHKDINFYLRNELVYTNKKDKLLSFNNRKSADECPIPAPNDPVNVTVNPSPSITPSISVSVTPTPSLTPTKTVTPTPSITSTPSVTPTITVSVSVTPTVSPTPSQTDCTVQ